VACGVSRSSASARCWIGLYAVGPGLITGAADAILRASRRTRRWRTDRHQPKLWIALVTWPLCLQCNSTCRPPERWQPAKDSPARLARKIPRSVCDGRCLRAFHRQHLSNIAPDLAGRVTHAEMMSASTRIIWYSSRNRTDGRADFVSHEPESPSRCE